MASACSRGGRGGSSSSTTAVCGGRAAAIGCDHCVSSGGGGGGVAVWDGVTGAGIYIKDYKKTSCGCLGTLRMAVPMIHRVHTIYEYNQVS